ncbi:hypothetical protein [Phyllobacterium sp. OV277]|uniref:hypothetical protein n=1 Tax=Phyllobacterium sp. OV277 TaxID=1882772 RepID=UPI000882975B|nr:hypothetical protein [Phyllobacterium sp. OV277]SDP65459.1 hypothetical protein SAMN05443582_107140 [Phyllobacterium sp. OV277]
MTIDSNMLIYAIFMINLIGIGGFFAARYEFNQLRKETERSKQQIARARQGLREQGLPAE